MVGNAVELEGNSTDETDEAEEQGRMDDAENKGERTDDSGVILATEADDMEDEETVEADDTEDRMVKADDTEEVEGSEEVTAVADDTDDDSSKDDSGNSTSGVSCNGAKECNSGVSNVDGTSASCSGISGDGKVSSSLELDTASGTHELIYIEK